MAYLRAGGARGAVMLGDEMIDEASRNGVGDFGEGPGCGDDATGRTVHPAGLSRRQSDPARNANGSAGSNRPAVLPAYTRPPAIVKGCAMPNGTPTARITLSTAARAWFSYV